MPFEFQKLSIEGLILVKPKIFKDQRGFFTESYKKSDFKKNGIDCDFVQDNHSFSVKNVIRGLHFQKPPFEQSKLVRCLKGEIMDVAVDMRKDSPNYLKWEAVVLSEANCHMLFIPKGFAHGFLVLSEYADVYYKCDLEYAPDYDAGVRYDDPDINISWGVSSPSVSDKDMKLPFIKDLKF